MVKKWVYYGLSIVFLLLVAAFVGWEFIPRSGNEVSEQQRNFIETILLWSTVGFGVVLAVILIAGQLTGRGRSGKEKVDVPERATLAAPAPAPGGAAITEPFMTITPIIAPLDYPVTRMEDLQAGISGEAEVKEGLLNWTEVIPGNAQHIGAREEQQDSFSFSALDDPAAVRRYGILAVLADGMGGLAMGREASQLAVQAMLNEYTGKTAEEPVPVALERALHKANEEVYGLAKRHELEWSVGTTLIAAVIQEGRLYWISAGDSRIYLYRGGVLIQLTRDHVYANRLHERVKAGQMTREEAETHPERALLTSYLGIPILDEIDANRAPFTLQAGDWVLLCSDGLYDDLSEQLLEEAVRLPPQHAAEFILEHVISQQRLYQDNATIAILACL
ncbi:PP2C family protein-serine/threonine phosphatase [Paenibacillus prosopidis]|uniref:Serine/threonine protein phosphatase PrpC n=1 Tax=Paenibacillus prosopidis TaxID=630520 RepID=A0A368VSM6_9BACL|nr:protein phosphatase 2C domain-containing protein [Paenibacillus prosopidis]RCW44967.1 serine/threonine protein phosphatase PrpC [Paenibacillus prosopidis]